MVHPPSHRTPGTVATPGDRVGRCRRRRPQTNRCRWPRGTVATVSTSATESGRAPDLDADWDREFQRQLGFDIDHGHLQGLGDISLVTNLIVLRTSGLYHDTPSTYDKDGKLVALPKRGDPDFSATVNVLAGIKLPTGDASRLKENYKPEVEDAPDSGIGPHDLTLGTGSV